MASELETLREHAERLAKAAHTDDCLRIHRITKLIRSGTSYDWDVTLSCASTTGHDSHEWVGVSGVLYDCPGLCGGCMTDRERELWRQIADEVGTHLARDDDAQEALL